MFFKLLCVDVVGLAVEAYLHRANRWEVELSDSSVAIMKSVTIFLSGWRGRFTVSWNVVLDAVTRNYFTLVQCL